MVEITFAAAKSGEARAWVTIEVFNGDCLMNTSVVTYELTENMTPYRYVLSSQMYDDNMEIKITFHTEAGDLDFHGKHQGNLPKRARWLELLRWWQS